MVATKASLGELSSYGVARSTVTGAPFTVDTMPEATLKALAQETQLSSTMTADGGDCEQVLAEFTAAGIDIDALAERLQDEGTKAFEKSWNSLMAVIASKREPEAKAA